MEAYSYNREQGMVPADQLVCVCGYNYTREQGITIHAALTKKHSHCMWSVAKYQFTMPACADANWCHIEVRW